MTNAGQGGDRNGYTGRLGVLLHSQGRHVAIGAGAGGGMSPTAGGWGSVDVHGVVAGANRHIRPVLGGSLGYSAPFGHRTFGVREPDSASETVLQLPHNAIAQVHVGLEIGPPDFAVVLGISVLHFWLREDSRVSAMTIARTHDEQFAAIGIGLRIGVD